MELARLERCLEARNQFGLHRVMVVNIPNPGSRGVLGHQSKGMQEHFLCIRGDDHG